MRVSYLGRVRADATLLELEEAKRGKPFLGGRGLFVGKKGTEVVPFVDEPPEKAGEGKGDPRINRPYAHLEKVFNAKKKGCGFPFFSVLIVLVFVAFSGVSIWYNHGFEP